MKKRRTRTLALIAGLFVMILATNSLPLGGLPVWAKNAPAAATPLPYLYTGLPQVVVVSGTNYEMGVQYGEQAAPAISYNIAAMKGTIYQMYGGAAGFENDMKVWAYYADKYDPTLRDWLTGIQDGCRHRGYDVSYYDLILIPVFPVEMWSRPKDPYPPEALAQAQNTKYAAGPSEEYHSCNSFLATGAATKDGKPMLAISAMVPIQTLQSVILIAFPKHGPSFVTFPDAGAVARNQGMNSAGFAWALTAITQAHPVWGVVGMVYFHYLTQIATSPADAVAFLANTPRAGTTGNIPMADAAGNISIFESEGPYYHVRTPGSGGEASPFMVNANHLIDPSMQQYNSSYTTPGSKIRYATLWQYVAPAAAASLLDFHFAKQAFTSDDWYDPVANVWHYNQPGYGNVINNWGSSPATTQNIFFPATLTAYLSAGTPSGVGLPAYATGEYAKIRLGKHPEAVAAWAYEDALAFYGDASKLFYDELRRHAAYMTPVITHAVRENLEDAAAALMRGMAARIAGFHHRNASHGAAMTQYVQAQLYSQMATSTMERAKAGKVSAYLQTRAPGSVSVRSVTKGQSIDMSTVPDPVAAATTAYNNALASYTTVRNLFQHEVNANAAYLTASLAREVKEALDEAFAAFEVGMDRAGRAYLEVDSKERLSLYADALACYAAAQQQSQQANTMLLNHS